jgi:hypothetical protein
MKRGPILVAGLSLLLVGSTGVFALELNDVSANQKISSPDASPLPTQTTIKFKALSQSKGNSDLVQSPTEESGVTRDFSVSEPVELSSGPAPTEAPMPRAGWIGLAGVLGVMVARWFSAAKRSRMKSAAG